MYIVGFYDGANKYYLDMLCSSYNDACDITSYIHNNSKYEVYVFKRDSVPSDFKPLPWDIIFSF